MEIHEAFAEWASERGIEINGIAAHTFEGRGVGIIAEKRHATRKQVRVLLPRFSENPAFESSGGASSAIYNFHQTLLFPSSLAKLNC